MKKFIKVTLFCLPFLCLSIIFADLSNWIYSQIVIMELPAGSTWNSNEPQMSLLVDDEGHLNGTAILDNTEIPVSFSPRFRGSVADIIHDDNENMGLLLKGSFRVSWGKNKIVLKKIVVYDESLLSLNEVENKIITFYRQE